MKRFISAFITIAALALAIGGRSYATDADPNMFYDGPIDMFNGGLPLTEGEDSTPSQVNVSDGSIYDRNNEMFVYYLTDGTVMVSVADGMIVTGEVRLAASEDANAVLYKDGEAFDGIPASVNIPGSYTLVDKGDTAGQIMTFRIINQVTGAISQYPMPSGFSVKSVYINGNEEITDYGRVDMNKEGEYQIDYICTDNGISYNLSVTVDHTPPQVEFVGLDDDNRAKGPVTITGLEQGDAITVYHNGEEKGILSSKTQLNESGDYSVIISDVAGNTVEREFRILIYLDIKAWMFIGFVLLLIVGAAIVLTITRKNLKVR